MDRVKKKNWQEIYTYLQEHDEEFVVFEEPVEENMLRQFNVLMAKIAENIDDLPLSEDADLQDSIPALFDEKITDAEKKCMMVLFATSGNIACYRALEQYLAGDMPLRSFALVAHQHARMVLEMTILEKVPLYISSPLGGKDKAIRYALTLRGTQPGTIPPYIKTLIKKECEFIFAPNNITVERIAFKQQRIGIVLLIPAVTNPYEFIESLIDNINSCGELLEEAFSLTNTSLPSFMKKKK
ncbi:MAG: hypothetical protein ACRDDZ_07845 [Marinifilaceae bacterium]